MQYAQLYSFNYVDEDQSGIVSTGGFRNSIGGGGWLILERWGVLFYF